MTESVTPEHPLLRVLFEQAEGQGLWFFSRYQHLWFSPKELREAMAEGRFRWGVSNWELRDPQALVDEAQQKLYAAQRELEAAKARVYRGGRRG